MANESDQGSRQWRITNKVHPKSAGQSRFHRKRNTAQVINKIINNIFSVEKNNYDKSESTVQILLKNEDHKKKNLSIDINN